MSDIFPKQMQFKSKLEWLHKLAGTASFENFQSNTSFLQVINKHFKISPKTLTELSKTEKNKTPLMSTPDEYTIFNKLTKIIDTFLLS